MTTSTSAKLQGLRRSVGRAIGDFNMISDGDRIMVCLSGGKDSYTLLDVLLQLQRSAPIRFELVAVNLDQKQPGFPEQVLPDYLNALGVAYHVIEEDTYSTVSSVIEPGKTTCGLCSRLRRGILYRFAKTHGIHKIALGHHADDMLETMMLNLFHAGSIKSMPPKLVSDDGINTVIRPLAYTREAEIAAYSAEVGHPIIPCNLCGSQPNLQRQHVKAMLNDWEQRFPGRIENMLAAMGRIAPSQMLDRTLHDFSKNGATPDAMEAAFDPFAIDQPSPDEQVLTLGEPAGNREGAQQQ